MHIKNYKEISTAHLIKNHTYIDNHASSLIIIVNCTSSESIANQHILLIIPHATWIIAYHHHNQYLINTNSTQSPLISWHHLVTFSTSVVRGHWPLWPSDTPWPNRRCFQRREKMKEILGIKLELEVVMTREMWMRDRIAAIRLMN